MSYLKDREVWLEKTPTGNPPAGYFWKFIQDGVVVVRDSDGVDRISVDKSGGTMTGLLRATAGINFNASGGDTLDDYEIGTFTPILSFGGSSAGITYTKNVCQYLKIGKTAFLTLDVSMSNKGSATGSMEISVPFLSADIEHALPSSINIIWGRNFTVAHASLGGFVVRNGTYLALFDVSSGATLTNSNFNNDTTIRLGVFYFTAT